MKFSQFISLNLASPCWLCKTEFLNKKTTVPKVTDVRQSRSVRKHSPNLCSEVAAANLHICNGGSWTSFKLRLWLMRESKIHFPLKHASGVFWIFSCLSFVWGFLIGWSLFGLFGFVFLFACKKGSEIKFL